MQIQTYKKSQCINGCTLFNDNSDYLYWENRGATTDEIEIVNYLNENNFSPELKIFHTGIGNSYVALNVKKFEKIDGISISKNEVDYANNLNIKKYNTYFLNKYCYDAFSEKDYSSYDIIIDVNLKSFSCCERAFEKLFSNYVSMLREDGKIITGRKGMEWSRIVKPVISFSFKKLFYKRLKEYNGPDRNKLKIENCKNLCQKYNLELNNSEKSNVVFFKKTNNSR